jgi:hypothetical protein
MLTQEEAKSIFECREGILYWRKNGQKAGAFSCGYTAIRHKRKRYYAHQIVYLIYRGYIPKLIDHIDRNTQNNLIENLREANKKTNAQNSKIRVDNKSGAKGVVWHKKAKKWMVNVTVDNKTRYLGLYENLDLAKELSVFVRQIIHGKFANVEA